MIVDLHVHHAGSQIASGSVIVDEDLCRRLNLDFRRLVFKSELSLNTHVPELRFHVSIDPDQTGDPMYEPIKDDGEENEPGR